MLEWQNGLGNCERLTFVRMSCVRASILTFLVFFFLLNKVMIYKKTKVEGGPGWGLYKYESGVMDKAAVEFFLPIGCHRFESLFWLFLFFFFFSTTLSLAFLFCSKKYTAEQKYTYYCIGGHWKAFGLCPLSRMTIYGVLVFHFIRNVKEKKGWWGTFEPPGLINIDLIY